MLCNVQIDYIDSYVDHELEVNVHDNNQISTVGSLEGDGRRRLAGRRPSLSSLS
jgi:hypothetical protein